MKKNIVLVGFMGAGKSLISKHLAQDCNMTRVSTDDLIIKREKRVINDIFANSGEEYFRKVEREVVAEVSEQENVVVDCGGGVVLASENVVNLKKKGTVFYLLASPEVIFERIKDERHRPLLNTPDPKAKIEELLAQRKAFYHQADHIIETDNRSVEDICSEIKEIMAS